MQPHADPSRSCDRASSAIGIDFGRRSRDYARHRPGFPASFYDRLESFIPLAGIDALDLATGPGVVALELAARGATVTGIDMAPNQIESARQRAAERGLAERATFRVARAEETALPDRAFMLITAAQCWRWLDPALLMPEVHRLLRPGGLLVVAFFDYLAGQSKVAAATEELILQHHPGWTLAGKDGLYPHLADQLIGAGLQFVHQFCYDHEQPFTHEGWRGRIRTCNGVGSGIMTDRQVEAFDVALATLLEERFPGEPLIIPHRVWATIARLPAPRDA